MENESDFPTVGDMASGFFFKVHMTLTHRNYNVVF